MSRHFHNIPRFLKGTIPAGRILMVTKWGWRGLRGFGRKHPDQRTDLKPEHPGLVVKDGAKQVINTNADAGQTVFHIHMHLLGGRRMGWPPG
jgi:hypothetical protein